jgi:hypothetical protein
MLVNNAIMAGMEKFWVEAREVTYFDNIMFYFADYWHCMSIVAMASV